MNATRGLEAHAAPPNKKMTSRRKPMSNAKDAVRKILDSVKADKRTSLTAPEGKLVCDAYGIPVPRGRRGQLRRRSRQDCDRDGLSGGHEDRLAGYPSQDRSRRRDGGREHRRRRRNRITRPFWPTPGNTKPMPGSKASRSSRCCSAARKSSSARSPTDRSASWSRSAWAACWSKFSRTSPSGWRRRAGRTRCRCWTASRPMKCSKACAAAIRPIATPSPTSSSTSRG